MIVVETARVFGEKIGNGENGGISLGASWRTVIHAPIGHHDELIIAARAFCFWAVIERLAHLLGSCELCARPGVGIMSSVRWICQDYQQDHAERSASRHA